MPVRTRVKICGITNGSDARHAARLGADYLGFNFYAGSPRCISPLQARKIIRRLPGRVIAVGVFVDAPLRRVRQVAQEAGLAVVQLHGRESARQVTALANEFVVWKAIRVRGKVPTAQLKKFRHADAILLDTFRRGQKGGTGRTFDWRLARAAKRAARIVLAGGLTPENVAEAVRRVRPFAVDVASGVEKRPGKKDVAKMRKFIREVRKAK